ncbi:four helix bundle protein [Gemmatimonas sp.]|uniref:four helix bundle protein n=1 Tax=Gemmatimonas sp. TaxID=1962908 RepID=UPI00333EFA97
MHDFRNLHVWKRAIDLAVRVHAITRRISPAVAPGLRNQLCRAAASVPANIAEGARQETSAQTARFLSYAIGSTSEVESHLELAHRLAPHTSDVQAAIDELIEVRRMLCALRSYHKRKSAN